MDDKDLLKNRVVDVFVKTFKISAENYRSDLQPGQLKEWDSLGNEILLMNLEKEFDIEFSEDEILEVNTSGDLEALILSKVSGNESL